jgi:hypothetical protein
MMRKLLLLFALLSAASLAQGADTAGLATNSVSLGMQGTLEILTPKDWTLVHTNMHLPGDPPSVELHSVSNTIIIRLSIYWDGFGGKLRIPSGAQMRNIVTTNALQYLPISVEKTFDLEQLHGPGVTGTFARLTDARWSPVMKDQYHNLATGMFRCENLWGTFDLLTNDKNGPLFKQGLMVMESLRRKP